MRTAGRGGGSAEKRAEPSREGLFSKPVLLKSLQSHRKLQNENVRGSTSVRSLPPVPSRARLAQRHGGQRSSARSRLPRACAPRPPAPASHAGSGPPSCQDSRLLRCRCHEALERLQRGRTARVGRAARGRGARAACGSQPAVALGLGERRPPPPPSRPAREAPGADSTDKSHALPETLLPSHHEGLVSERHLLPKGRVFGQQTANQSMMGQGEGHLPV